VADVNQLDLDQAVVAVAEIASQLYEGAATSLTLDIGASGEHPYRVEIPDEPLPLIGMGVGVPLSQLGGIGSAAEPNASQVA
jgi:hypothetical protein